MNFTTGICGEPLLQAWKSWVRFPFGSLGIFIDFLFLQFYSPEFDSESDQNGYGGYLQGWGGGSKSSQCLGLKTLPPSCGGCLEFLEISTSCSTICLSRSVQGWLICGELCGGLIVNNSGNYRARGYSAGCMYWGADKSLPRPRRKQARKHVRDARDFNNIETRAVIKLFIFYLQGKAPKEFHAILRGTLACFLPGRAEDLSAPQ